jgi:hypothetical protein
MAYVNERAMRCPWSSLWDEIVLRGATGMAVALQMIVPDASFCCSLNRWPERRCHDAEVQVVHGRKLGLGVRVGGAARHAVGESSMARS